MIASVLQVNNSQAAFIIYPGNIKTDQNAPDHDYLRADIFIKLSPAEFSAITGKRLYFFERLMFKTIQKRIK